MSTESDMDIHIIKSKVELVNPLFSKTGEMPKSSEKAGPENHSEIYPPKKAPGTVASANGTAALRKMRRCRI